MSKKHSAGAAKFAAYYRVSTRHQGKDGLGMAAQKHAVETFLKREPDYAFTEVETGRKDTRPQLERALACCRRTGAKLVIAKLDRLSRNARFLLKMRDSGLDFVCCDVPQADRFTVGILALVAEREAELISERTKAGLAAAKRKGVKLGNPRPARSLKKTRESRQRNRAAFIEKMTPVVRKAQAAGVTTLQELADALNARGFKSMRGKQWYPSNVRLLKLATGNIRNLDLSMDGLQAY